MSHGVKDLKIGSSAAYSFELLPLKKGELVAHEGLYEYAWRRFGMEPTSASLYQSISSLRRFLKEVNFLDECIITTIRRGYSFNTNLNIDIDNSVVIDEIKSAVSVEPVNYIFMYKNKTTKSQGKLRGEH